MANEKQREFWSGKGGDNWVEHQVSMDHMLGPLGERALNKLDPIAGENILDIGCGTGPPRSLSPTAWGQPDRCWVLIFPNRC